MLLVRHPTQDKSLFGHPDSCSLNAASNKVNDLLKIHILDRLNINDKSY